jgi:multisubunit Na+/H+ antiporter MnhF subunit
VSRVVLVAWIVVAVCVVAAVVALIARPQHWERTVGAAVVVGVIAAILALYQSRRAPVG